MARMVGRRVSICVQACTASSTPSDAVAVVGATRVVDSVILKSSGESSVGRAGGGRSGQVVDRASYPAQLGRMETWLVVRRDDAQELVWPRHHSPACRVEVVPPARFGARRQVGVDGVHESHAAYEQPQ